MANAGGTLLILGNGFDLQCGLKSSYPDFFDWLRKGNDRANTNLWAVHFLSDTPTGTLWVDIEGRLLRNMLGGQGRNFRSSIMMRWAKNAKGNAWYTSTTSEASKYIANHIRDKGKALSHAVFDSYWFLDELRAFERQFCEYMKAEVARNTDYLANATKLMKAIVDGDKVDVINFNYTNPFASGSADEKLRGMVDRVTNVHGTFDDNNIIFGVDLTEDLPIEAHIFTKTHRKMLQGTPARALHWHVNKIKFYGHSLAKADYSYFHSIFDNYNLYGDSLAYGTSKTEQVELQFYFTIYDEDKKSEIVRKATDSVYKLITEYGTKFDNKDKGKNLLHKLLLEGRVQIKELN